MGDLVEASALLSLAREKGLNINRRTLRLYADTGLIPRPFVRNRDDGGRTGYYDPRTLKLLEAIEKMKSAGYSLRDIKEFFRHLENVAAESGRDPLEVKVEAVAAIFPGRVRDGGYTGSSRTNESADLTKINLWREIGGAVVSQMLRMGLECDVRAIAEIRASVITEQGNEVTVPVFLNARSVCYDHPSREDDSDVGILTAAYVSELTGKVQEPAPAENIREWLETSYDISREHFIVARAPKTSTDPKPPLIGFCALGVEPERLRAGQVRLEGPYVVPAYRGYGVGAELFRKAEEMAREIGARYIDAFLSTRARNAISFAEHFGFQPCYFLYEARVKLVKPEAGKPDPLAERSRSRYRLVIKPIDCTEELEKALDLTAKVMRGAPGFYPVTAEDLEKTGLVYPMEDHFNAYLDGELIGTAWNSTGSNRVYVNVLPRYKDKSVEAQLWRHILRHVRAKGYAEARTEVVYERSSRRRVPASLGFNVITVIVCYRKYLNKE